MIDLIDLDIYENDELKHYGTIGMKWGIRRYQNPDGTLTPEGRIRYGVKSAADAVRISYSEKYNRLKAKENKTEKEQKELEKLEIGKSLLERKISDPDKFVKDFEKFPKDMQQELHECLNEYVGSTNYGKGESFAAGMMAIPVGAVGAAADIGMYYALSKAGLVPVIGPSFTVLSGLIGMGIGATIYANKHEQEFYEDYTDVNGNRKHKDIDKSLQKYINEDIDWVKKNYEGAVAYDPNNNMVAREKGRDYSEMDKKYLEWQKQHIHDYAKKNL